MGENYVAGFGADFIVLFQGTKQWWIDRSTGQRHGDAFDPSGSVSSARDQCSQGTEHQMFFERSVPLFGLYPPRDKRVHTVIRQWGQFGALLGLTALCSCSTGEITSVPFTLVDMAIGIGTAGTVDSDFAGKIRRAIDDPTSKSTVPAAPPRPDPEAYKLVCKGTTNGTGEDNTYSTGFQIDFLIEPTSGRFRVKNDQSLWAWTILDPIRTSGSLAPNSYNDIILAHKVRNVGINHSDDKITINDILGLRADLSEINGSWFVEGPQLGARSRDYHGSCVRPST